MNSQQIEDIKTFLNKCSIPLSNIDDLNGMMVPREICLDNTTYNNIKGDIITLKKIFNSSYLTALQSTAENNQKWPLLNLIRQILKSINYKMTPKRISAGYTKDGKKLFKRMFLIEKLNQISSSSNTISVSSDNSSTLGDSKSNTILSGSTSLN